MSIRQITLSTQMTSSGVQAVKQIFSSVATHLNPRAATGAVITVKPNITQIGMRRINTTTPIHAVVIGKGYNLMPTIQDILGRRLTSGLLITKTNHVSDADEALWKKANIQVIRGAHPYPDKTSEAAGNQLISYIRSIKSGHLICGITGGGSAIVATPEDGMTIDDIQLARTTLVESGLSIGDINSVMKHLTKCAGGKLLNEVCKDVSVQVLAISDVIGDDPSSIASGPFSPDPSTFASALELLTSHALDHFPARCLQFLQEGAQGLHAETVKESDPVSKRLKEYLFLASNTQAKESVTKWAEKEGYGVVIMASPVTGEASLEGQHAAHHAMTIQNTMKPGDKPIMVIYGGEPVVTISKDTPTGIGSRSMEFVTSALLTLNGRPGITVGGFETDGTAGPTDAAGVVGDGDLLLAAKAKGIDLQAALSSHTTYEALKSLDALIFTGPTGTNVNDVYCFLIKSKYRF